MMILLGSTGMVGNTIKTALTAQGNEIWTPDRQFLQRLQDPNHQDACILELREKVTPHTILINAIGIAPGFGDAKQRAAYLAQKIFIDHCIALDIGKIITVSALSNYPNPNEIPYLKYKYALDNAVLKNHTQSYVVRPSLVYADNGESTKFFKLLAKSPVLAFPKNPNYAVSPIHIDDLVSFILALLPLDLPSQIFEVGSETITLGKYLQCFNHKLTILPLPEWMMALSMRALGTVLPAVAGQYAFALLQAGSTNSRDDFTKIMGQPAKFPLTQRP